MSDKSKSSPPEPPKPVDVRDGIPDRSGQSPKRVFYVLAAVFLGWLLFLIYCAAAGNP